MRFRAHVLLGVTATLLLSIGIMGLFNAPTAAQSCTLDVPRTINLRNGPGTNFIQAGQLGAGDRVNADAQIIGTDGLTWWRLTSGDWVRSDLVTEGSGCDALPEERYNDFRNLYPEPPDLVIPDRRNEIPANARLLNNGIGLSTGARMNAGKIQVEGFCSAMGYRATRGNGNWFCSGGNRRAFQLYPLDFDAICRATYGVSYTFAARTGPERDREMTWRCYEPLTLATPVPSATNTPVVVTATPLPAQPTATVPPPTPVDTGDPGGMTLTINGEAVLFSRLDDPSPALELPPGESLPLVGIDAAGTHYRVRFDGSEYWVQATIFTVVTGGSVTDLPIVEDSSNTPLLTLAQPADALSSLLDDAELRFRLAVGEYPIAGISTTGDAFLITTDDEQRGWVFASVFTTFEGDLSAVEMIAPEDSVIEDESSPAPSATPLPVTNVPPSATALPSATATSTVPPEPTTTPLPSATVPPTVTPLPTETPIPPTAIPDSSAVEPGTLLYNEDFNAVGGWPTGSQDYAQIDISGGRMGLLLNDNHGESALVGPVEDLANVPIFGDSYELRVTISDGTCDSFGGDDCVFYLVFGVQGDFAEYMALRYDLDNNSVGIYNQDEWLGGYNINNSAPNLFDGGLHTLRMQVDPDFMQLFVDDEQWIITRSYEFAPSGTVGVGLGREFTRRDAYIAIEQLSVYSFVDPADVAEPYVANEEQIVTEYAHSFADGDGGWMLEEESNYSATIEDGRYVLSLTDDPTMRFGRYDTKYEVIHADYATAPYMTQPYEFFVNVDGMTEDQGGALCIQLLFDVEPDLRRHRVISYCNEQGGTDHYINQGVEVFGVYDNESFSFSIPVRASDARLDQPSTIGLRREEGRVVLLLDGRDAFSAGVSDPISGTVGVGVSRSSNDDGSTARLAINGVSINPVEELVVEAINPFTDAQLAAFREDPNTLFFADFADAPDTVTMTGDGRAADGTLNLSYSLNGERVNFERLLMDGIENVGNDFELEFEVSNLIEEGDSRMFFELVFNEGTYRRPGIFGSTTETANLRMLVSSSTYTSYALYDTVWGSSYTSLSLPAVLHLDDGETHRVKWRVSQLGGGINISLFVDEVLISEQSVLQEVSQDYYRPFVSQIDGAVYLNIGINGDGSASAALDNLILRRYQADDLVEGTGIGEANVPFESEIERLQLSLPEGWAEGQRANALDPDTDYFDSHTINVFNSPQGITGAANEVGMLLFDPVVVNTYARIADTRAESLQTVLEAFMRGIDGDPESGDLDELVPTLTFETREISGRQTLTTRIDLTQDTAWFAFRSSDERATVMVFSTSSGQYDDFAETIDSIIASADYPAPSQDYDGAEQAVLNYLTLAYLAQMDSAVNQACLEDVLVVQGAGLLLQDLGESGSAPAFDPIFNVRDVTFTIDTSGLFLESMDSLDDGVARVRIAGAVRRLYEDGTSQVIPHSTYFISGYDAFFGVNNLRVEQQNSGRWTVCSGAFTF